MEKFYIVLSRSNTLVAILIRIFTRKYYNHASICFKKDLSRFYSFGRKNPRFMLPAGFIIEGVHTGYFGAKPKTKIIVFEGELEKEDYDLVQRRLKEFLDNKEMYKYNILGLVTAFFKIPWHRKRHYTCSAFVASLFSGILDFGKDYSLVEPEDFYKFNFKVIYEGTAEDYSYEEL